MRLFGPILLALVPVTSPALAVEPEYLSEMPEPSRVIEGIEGKDRLDTLARQAAALGFVSGLIKEMAGTRYYAGGVYPTPDEQRILDVYGAEAGRIYEAARALYDPRGEDAFEPRRKWEKQRYAYATDRDFHDQVLARHFSAGFLDLRRATIGDLQGRVRQHKDEQRRTDDRLAGKRVSNWDSIGPQQRQGAVTAAVTALLLLGLGSWRELRRSGFVGTDFSRYRVGFRRYRIEWLTGTLSNYDASKETHSTITEAYNPETHETKRSYSSSTTLRETFDISGRRETGEQDLRNLVLTKSSHMTRGEGTFAARTDHRITVVWARRRFRKMEVYIAFRDWTEGRWVDHPGTDATAGALLASRKWTLLPAFFLGLAIGSATDLLAGLLPGLSDRGHGFIMAFVVALLWGILLAWWSSRRRKQFTERELPRLSEYLRPTNEAER